MGLGLGLGLALALALALSLALALALIPTLTLTLTELKALLPAAKYDELKGFLKEAPEADFDEYYDKPTTRS